MSTQLATIPQRSVTVTMAERYGMEAGAFEQTLRATVVPAKCTREELAAFLIVANEYELNPITKEIFAFPKQGGGIQPIVSVDGWCNLVNSHPQCDGFEFDDALDEAGNLTSITCRLYRKDRSRPTTATEYMSECKRDTSTWKQWPRRMLRHKALIQAARYAFGFAGIADPDEAERGEVIAPAPAAPHAPSAMLVIPSAPVRAKAAPKPRKPVAVVAEEPSEEVEREADRLQRASEEPETDEHDDYLQMMLGEWRSAPNDAVRKATRETFGDTLNGMVERGEIDQDRASELVSAWADATNPLQA